MVKLNRFRSISRCVTRPALIVAAAGAMILAPCVFNGGGNGNWQLAPTARADQDENVPPKVRDAVDKALSWLKDNQKPDGSWQAGGGSTTAIPSLAVMAFLARGHVPGQGPYGDILNKTIDFVLDSQQENGLLSKAREATRSCMSMASAP